MEKSKQEKKLKLFVINNAPFCVAVNVSVTQQVAIEELVSAP